MEIHLHEDNAGGLHFYEVGHDCAYDVTYPGNQGANFRRDAESIASGEGYGSWTVATEKVEEATSSDLVAVYTDGQVIVDFKSPGSAATIYLGADAPQK